MVWDARFWAVFFLTPLGRSRVSSGDIGADVTFQTSKSGRSPTKLWPVASGPWYLPYVLQIVVCSHRNNVQTNHMCDWPYCLHSGGGHCSFTALWHFYNEKNPGTHGQVCNVNMCLQTIAKRTIIIPSLPKRLQMPTESMQHSSIASSATMSLIKISISDQLTKFPQCVINQTS